MDFLWESITSWLKEVLVSGIISNLSGLFDTMNEQVGEIAAQVGTTPQAWNSGIFQMVHSLSETVILPVEPFPQKRTEKQMKKRNKNKIKKSKVD